MIIHGAMTLMALTLLLAVCLLQKETKLRRSLQTLLAQLLKQWRANEKDD